MGKTQNKEQTTKKEKTTTSKAKTKDEKDVKDTDDTTTQPQSRSRMKLPIWKKSFPKLVWGVVILIFAAFFLRVFLWEHNYYQEKEGSERAVATTGAVSQPIEVDETQPNVEEYVVAPDKPRYLSIPKLNVTNSRILEVGLSPEGQMLTPYNIFDVGWYNGSAKPGTKGTSIIDGHNGGPHIHGVFKNLPDLTYGDKISIEMGDGTVYTYQIVDNITVPLSEADAKMLYAAKSPVEGKESITLITCTGEWSQVQQTYLSRQFARAVKTE